MNNLVLISIIAVTTLVIIFAMWKLIFKRKTKKRKSFAHHYHDDLNFTKKEVEKMEFEQVSIDHFNAASKGLKLNKPVEKKENKLALKLNTPKMGM